MLKQSPIQKLTAVASLLAVVSWGAMALAQPVNPPPWWGNDDDRTTCVGLSFDNASQIPPPVVSADPNTDPAVMIESGGDAGWINEVAGHQGVMGVQGAGQMGSVVIWVWNGEGENSEKHVWLQYDSYVNQGAISGPSLTAGPPADSVGFHSPPPNPVDLGGGWTRHWREWTIKPQPCYEEIEFRMGTVPSGGSSAAAVIDNVQVGSHCENPPNPPQGKVCAFSMTEDVWPPDPVYVEVTSPGYEATTWSAFGSQPPAWMPALTNHQGVLGIPPTGVPADGIAELWYDDLAEPGGLKHIACQFDFYMAEGGFVWWEVEVPPGCVVEKYREYVFDVSDGWQRALLKLDVSPPPDWMIFRWPMFTDPLCGPVAIDSVIASSGFLFPDNWLDQFDIYDVGLGIHGHNGWKGRGDDPALDAFVTDVQAKSIFNSLDVAGGADVVHEFDGLDSGKWAFSAWQYIPGDFSSGPPPSFVGSSLILMNDYDDATPPEDSDISAQMNFDSNDGMLKVYYGDGLNTANVPYVPDEWIEIMVEIDLDADLCAIYYDGAFVAEYGWKGGAFGTVGGASNIAAVELSGNGATSIFYDDLHLRRGFARGDMNCDGLMEIGDVEPFVLRLTDPEGYAAAYGGCPPSNADVNKDGDVDGRDIQHFVWALIGG